MRTEYEWDIEQWTEDGEDIVDHNHSDKLAEFSPMDVASLDGKQYRLVLVRDYFDEDIDRLENRSWAYITLGKLPETFENGVTVPKRFHIELARFKQIHPECAGKLDLQVFTV